MRALRGVGALATAALAFALAPSAWAQPDAPPAGDDDYGEEFDGWEPEEASVLDERDHSGRFFSSKMALGPSLRGVFTQPLYGVEVEVALGARWQRSGRFIYGTIGYLRAETHAGLNVHRPVLGAMFEWEHDRVHLGIGPQLSMILVERVSSRGLMVSFGVGVDAVVSVDLYRGDEGDGLFLALHPGLALTSADPLTAFYGGALRLGYRF